MRNYHLPPTQDAVDAIERVKTGSTHQQIESQLSTGGKQVLKDLDNVLTIGQKLMTEKNRDDLLQQMVLHAKKATDLSNKEALKSMKGKGTELKLNVSDAYTKFINVVKLLISSGEFRSAMKGLVSVLMDIFKFNMGGGLLDVENVRQSSEDVRQEFHGVMTGDNSARDAAHRTVDIIADTTNKMVPDSIKEDISSSVRPHVDDAAEGSLSKSEATRRGIRDTFDVVKSRMGNMQVSDQHKEELFNRLRSNMLKFQARQDYKNALNDLFTAMNNVLETSKSYSKDQIDKGKMAVMESDADKEWKAAFDQARQLVENIFNGKSLSSIIDAVKTFAKDIREDNLLLAWFQGWKNFVQKMLSDEEFVQSDRFRNEAKQLSEQTTTVLRDKYRDHATNMVNEFKNFITGIAEDPSNKEFMESIRKLWADVCLDDNGNLTFKRELLDDVARVIPILADKVAYLPLPRIDYDGPDYSCMMNNVVLKCNGVIPTHVNVNMQIGTDLSVPEIDSQVTLSFSHVQVSAQEIEFEVRKKTRFFKFHEHGQLNFDIRNRGLSAELVFQPWLQKTHDGTQKGLDLKTCNVKIDGFRLHIYNADNHHLLYTLFKGMIAKMVKRTLQRTISDNLRQLLDPNAPPKDSGTDGKSKGTVKLSMPTGSGSESNADFRQTAVMQEHHDHVPIGGAPAASSTVASGNEKDGGVKDGTTSKLRHRLKMFRHGGDSTAVKG